MREYINTILRKNKVSKIFKRITISGMVSLDYIEVKTVDGDYYKLFIYYTKVGILNPEVLDCSIDMLGIKVDNYEELIKSTESKSDLEKRCRFMNKNLINSLNTLKYMIQNIEGTISVEIIEEPVPIIIATYKNNNKVMKPISYIFGSVLPEVTDNYIEEFNRTIGGSING